MTVFVVSLVVIAVVVATVIAVRADQEWHPDVLRAQLAAKPPGERDFTPQARKALWQLAEHHGPSPVERIEYQLLGIEAMAMPDRAAAMLQELAEGRWERASNHFALAGVGDMLVGVVLRIHARDGRVGHRWVALKLADEPFESDGVLTHDATDAPPGGAWDELPRAS